VRHKRRHTPGRRQGHVRAQHCDVLLPDGTNVNHTLVKDAWCWWYRKYALGVSATRPRGSYLRVDQLVGVKELELWPNNWG
jgi:hypothetical protein